MPSNNKSKHLVMHLAIFSTPPCIVFPWANGRDLSHFWRGNKPSDLGPADRLIGWFLSQMIGLSHGLEVIHAENIRHGDLKPPNILHFTDGSTPLGTLKITDFGESRAHPSTSSTEDRFLKAQKTITSASTPTYEAPEAHRDFQSEPRSKKFDCWSFGCVMIEFAIWLLYDYNAIVSLHWNLFPETRYYQPITKVNSPQDGRKIQHALAVHPKACEAMTSLLEDPRCRNLDGDDWTILGKAVSLAKDHLMRISREERFTAKELHHELTRLNNNEPGSFLFNGAHAPRPTPEIFCHVQEATQAPQYTS
jgi:serine/threonine protein kinase